MIIYRVLVKEEHKDKYFPDFLHDRVGVITEKSDSHIRISHIVIVEDKVFLHCANEYDRSHINVEIVFEKKDIRIWN